MTDANTARAWNFLRKILLMVGLLAAAGRDNVDATAEEINSAYISARARVEASKGFSDSSRCDKYIAVGQASCSQRTCWAPLEAFDVSTLNIRQSENEGYETACDLELGRYGPVFGNQPQLRYPTEVCVTARARSQVGIDRKARVKCDVSSQFIEAKLGYFDPPSRADRQTTGYQPGTYEYTFSDQPTALTVKLPFKNLEQVLKSQIIDGEGFRVDIHNVVFSAPQREQFSVALNAIVRTPYENFDCDISAAFTIPPVQFTVGADNTIRLVPLTGNVSCSASGWAGHTVGLDALISTAANAMLAKQLNQTLAGIVKKDDLEGFISDDPQEAELINFVRIQGISCQSRAGQALCLEASWPMGTLRSAREKLVASAPKATGSFDSAGLPQLKAQIIASAPRMPSFDNPAYTFPSKRNEDGYDSGDMALFGGLLCLSGEPEGCELVRNSQGLTGQYWRSPTFVDKEDDRQFSGDQFNGVVAYFVKTGDALSFEKFLAFVKTNKVSLPDDRTRIDIGFKTCSRDPGNNCLLGGQEWRWLGILAERLSVGGLPDSEADIANRYGDPVEGLRWLGLVNPLGYRLHLIGVQVYLAQRLGIANAATREAAAILAARQPHNPFFLYLHLGADNLVRDEIVRKCSGESRQKYDKWSWEVRESEEAWKASMGWDCVFMINNMLSNAR